MNKPLLRTALISSLALLLSASVAAQADDCAAATPISGLGSWPYDTTSATTDGAPTSGCGMIHNDVWFAWTAPSSDAFEINTCVGTTYDTKIAVYDSLAGCTGVGQLNCNNDTCGIFSAVAFHAIAGQTYLLRMGGYISSSRGAGTMHISIAEPCGTATGPDVIVGDVMDMNYYGTSAGISAYSLGTFSCNIGDQELDWFATEPRHPVIGQNMFRYEAGRFEMIGMSWLKHGFTALQQSLCCTCYSSGTGTRLGVGCADPYVASLNGSQPGLGPRFEVNAHTGAFAYPFTAQGQAGGTTYKRLQVHKNDIDPALHPGALYYGEGQYVTPDDAAWGNQNNNASWRPLVRLGAAGGGWDMDISSSTVREEPAIYAWLANDAGVQLEQVQVPGEGLFIVGSRATDNGDGTWHYEYAIQNLNSDLSGQSFSVPTGTGLAITNVGFHDVDYHSGEPFAGTDWSFTAAADVVRWESATYAVDPNANALRWGTLYNFRFDANAPPVAATATLGLFKPGGSDQFVAIIGPAGSGCTVSNYCLTSPNSLGPGALITYGGSASVSANDLTLIATGAIPAQMGLFFYGSGQTQVAFGDGWRCITGRFYRSGSLQVDALGQASFVVDNTALYGAGHFFPGATWNFQFWYQDPSGGLGFNLSNALSATFCP